MAGWIKKGLVLGGMGISLLLAACGSTGTSQTGTSPNQAAEDGAPAQAGAETLITGSGSAVTIEGEGASSSGVVVTIMEAGVYRLSGTIDDGQIRIEAGKEDEVELILDGFSIANSSSAAVYGVQSKKITLLLEENTENFISDGEEYAYENEEDDEPDAAVFSKDNLALEGKGILTVTGNYQDAIRGKDDVEIRSGTYVLTAKNDGIKGKDSVEIEDGVFTITAGGDGIQSSNDKEDGKGYVRIAGGNFTIEADKKGILAATEIAVTGGTFQIEAEDDSIHCDGNIRLAGGTFTLSSGDDAIHADQNVTIDSGKIHILKSYEGIEGLSIDINGGEITLTAEDDGLNAAGGKDSSGNGGRFSGDPFSTVEGAYIRITGGILHVDASGDGIDSNGDLYLDGGTVYVEGPERDGDGTLDYNGVGEVNGGIFLGTGSSGMLQAFGSGSKQNSLVIYYDEEQAAGTEIKIIDADGREIEQTVPAKKFSSLIFSSPELADGTSIRVLTGGAELEITVDGVITQSGTPASRGGKMMGGREKPENRTGSREKPEGEGALENGEKAAGRGPMTDGERPEDPDSIEPGEGMEKRGPMREPGADVPEGAQGELDGQKGLDGQKE